VAVLAVDLEEVVSTTNDLLEIPLFQVGPMGPKFFVCFVFVFCLFFHTFALSLFA